jgi:hypothetical protein
MLIPRNTEWYILNKTWFFSITASIQMVPGSKFRRRTQCSNDHLPTFLRSIQKTSGVGEKTKLPVFTPLLP